MTSRGSLPDRATEAETLIIIREASQPKSAKAADDATEAQLNHDHLLIAGEQAPIPEVVKSYDFSRIRGQKFSIDKLNRLKGVSNFKFQ